MSTQFTTHILNSKLVFGTYVNVGRPNILRWHSRPCTILYRRKSWLCNTCAIYIFFKLMRYSIPVPLVAYYAFPMANHKIANDSRLAVSIQNNKMYRFTNIQWWIHKLSGQGEALLFLFAEWNLFFREENKTCTTNSNSPSYVRETILPKCARASTDGQTDRQTGVIQVYPLTSLRGYNKNNVRKIHIFVKHHAPGNNQV